MYMHIYTNYHKYASHKFLKFREKIFNNSEFTPEERHKQFDMSLPLHAIVKWYHDILEFEIPPLNIHIIDESNACPFCNSKKTYSVI
jgi:hypothetical protein